MKRRDLWIGVALGLALAFTHRQAYMVGKFDGTTETIRTAWSALRPLR